MITKEELTELGFVTNIFNNNLIKEVGINEIVWNPTTGNFHLENVEIYDIPSMVGIPIKTIAGIRNLINLLTKGE